MKQVIYIANSDSKNIEVWNLHKNGNMDLIQQIETEGEVQPIKIITKNNLLYAGIHPNNKIIVYSINKIGLLEKKNESTIPGKANYISFDQTKNFLFCSSYHSNFVSVSPLNKHGIPQNPIQIIYDIKGCHAAKMNYKYNILFVLSLKENCIYLYHLTEFGILKNTEQNTLYTEKNTGPRHIVFHPNQNFIYTINELNGIINVWEIYKIKNLVQVKNIQKINILNHYNPKNYWSADIHLTSCGRFLYATDRLFNSISLFHINQNSHKICFFKSYITTECPRSFCIDSNNAYLIVVGEKSNTLNIYSINQDTGELKKINTYKTSQRPIWVTIHQLTSYL